LLATLCFNYQRVEGKFFLCLVRYKDKQIPDKDQIIGACWRADASARIRQSSIYIGRSNKFESLLVVFYSIANQLDVSGAIFSGGYKAAE
jgi:hypothetical protein